MKTEILDLFNGLWLGVNFSMFFIVPFSASDIENKYGWEWVCIWFVLLILSSYLNDLLDKYIQIEKGK